MTGQSTASSLYSGIFNLAKSDEASSDAGPSGQPITDSSTESKPQSTPTEVKDQKPLLDKTQAWSSALRFTPRRNAASSKPKRAPIPSQLSTAFSSTDVHSDVAESSSAKQATQQQGEVAASSVSSSFQPKVESAKPSSQPKHFFGVQTHALNVEPEDSDRIPLPTVTQPPSLSLSVEEIEKDRALFRSRALKRGDVASHEQTDFGEDDGWNEEEDVNGFANTTEGRKARRKKRKRRASPGHHGGLTASLNMDADYDPRVPNDFVEFRKLLTNRREAERSHRKRLEREEQGFEEATKYGDRSEKDDDRRNRNRYDRSGKFAPPVAYLNHSREMQREFDKMDDDNDEKPYLSPPPTLPPGPPPTLPPGPPPIKPPSVVTGEDAYQRRLAISQATSGEEAYQRRLAMSQGSVNDYGSSSSSHPKANQSDDLASRSAAAAAIAARLIKSALQEEMKVSISNTSSAEGQDPSTFAERLMMKQGWRKGEALGAEGNKGILDPLLAQKIDQERARQYSKHQKNDDQGNDRAMKSARGTIINPQEEQKRQEERQKYGEASEVILLENMVASDEDIDDDLPGEIGEECEKHGKVERVFIWPAAHAKVPFTNSSLALSASFGKPRIFVKFSGIAAAWKCLKELDGRFFAGNTVRARYYPLQDFNRGKYDRLYD